MNIFKNNPTTTTVAVTEALVKEIKQGKTKKPYLPWQKDRAILMKTQDKNMQ